MISNEYPAIATINISGLQESSAISPVRGVFSLVVIALLAAVKLIVLFTSLQQAANAAPLYPLKVSASGRYLVDQNNIPFLISGDSPQALIGNLSESDANFFFANRESYGFNAMWINLLCNWGTRCDSSGNTYDGIPPFTTPRDLSTPNEDYFARADRMIQLAADHGMTVFLDPIETIGWLDILRSNGLAKARAYGQYLGNRYKNFDNIVWMSGNDFQTWDDPRDDELVREVALGIKDYDTRHIHTVGLDYLVSTSLDDASWAPIIELNAAYTYYPTYAEVIKAYNQSSAVPVFMVEANYEFENAYAGNVTLRRQEYWTNLSGATGQLYGHRDTWGFSDGWKDTFNTAGSEQMAIVKSFFESHRWYDLIPDQNHTTVIAGYGTFSSSSADNADNRSTLRGTDINTNDYTTTARTPDGALVIAYMPTLRTLTVDMSQLSGPVTATWFDPSNGAYIAIANSPFANTGTRQFTPIGNNNDGDEDWVLVLEVSTITPPLVTDRNGLVAAYGFEESTGTTATDASGNGNNGTISNAVRIASGKYGKALSFNGVDALVTVQDSASLDLTTGMTLEAWVKPSTVTSTWRDVIYKGHDNYFLEATSPQGGQPGGGGTFGETGSEVYGPVALAANTWTHLALTYDGATLRLFVNGTQVSSQATITGNISTSANPLQIGGDSVYGQYFQGYIDEVRIYNRALTSTELSNDLATAIRDPSCGL